MKWIAMKEKTEDTILLILVGVLIGVITCVIIMNNEYKDGQIDAINGDIKYELVIQDDKTTKWELI